jgi:very-short-patch-repair endonuclease
MSPPERILWSLLRKNQLGLKFRRQYPIGPYIADFYCADVKLVNEIDSDTAHGTEEAETHDRRRDEYMRQQGLTVLRIPAHEIFYNLAGVTDTIRTALPLEVCEVESQGVSASWQ